MKKNSTHLYVIFFLMITVCSAYGRHSRKRYHQAKKNVAPSYYTHIDVDTSTPKPIEPYSGNLAPDQFLGLGSSTMPSKLSYYPKEEPLPAEAEYIPAEKNVEAPADTEPSDDFDNIELNFEHADLQNFVKQIEDIFEVTFISDDALQPLPQGKKSLKGNKITLKTHKPLTKKETWNLFLSFLDLSGFTVIPHTEPRVFRITTTDSARKSALPSYIGVDYTTLPNSDEIIRYIYFLENASTETIKAIIDPLRSSSSQGLIELKEHKGFMITDKSYNIKMLMKIVKELDKVSMPESMAILKLRNANAKQVQELYASLLPKDEGSSRFFTKKQPTSAYFPENTRIIAEPRTNTLILLGPIDAIKKIETFIIKYIDVELDQAYSPLYTYQLKYADATTIASIMNEVTAFGRDTEAGKYGGVRGKDEYMRPISFIPERETNRLIIKGYYEDYVKAVKVLDQLDEAQPQVAIEVLIVSVNTVDTRSLGAQLRSKVPGPNGLLGNNIKFQTSGLYANNTGNIVTNPLTGQPTEPNTGIDRLLGNLLNLVTGATPGTTLLTLGKDALGVWGIFQALQTITDAEVISNPFLLATNNTKANVALGTMRRVVTSQVIGGADSTTNAFGNDSANLDVTITPQINSDGMIVIKVSVELDEFTDPNDPTSATKLTRNITTNAILANQEVLALGGLIRNNTTTNETKVPILGDIPIIGWLFKNKRKTELKQNLLVLISTRIIAPHTDKDAKAFTDYHIADYENTIARMHSDSDRVDPIHRAFFQDKQERAREATGHDALLFERNRRQVARQREAVRNNEKEKDENVEDVNPYHNNEATYDINSHQQDMIVHNKRLSSIRRKKRNELSLSQFISHEEATT